MAAPLLNTKQQIAIELEATAGTAETLVDADVLIHTGIAEFEVEAQSTDREFNSAVLSPRGSVTGAITGIIRFKTYLRGTSGAPAVSTNEPDFTDAFKCCGALAAFSGGGGSEITTYTPSSTAIVDVADPTGYATVGLYEDGKFYSIKGAQGNCKLTFETGMPVLAEFEFRGVYVEPTDTALLSPTYTSIVEPAFLGASMTVLTDTVNFKTFTLDFGNEVIMRPNPNDTSGFFTAQIVSRKPVGTIDPEEFLAGTKNFWNEWTALTSGSITTGSFPSGGAQYNIFNLTIPNATYRQVNKDSRDGISTVPIEFDCRANSDGGDDEWSLVQS